MSGSLSHSHILVIINWGLDMAIENVASFINGLTNKITAIAWALFLLTWSIGWMLRGSPLPFSKLKRIGTTMIEDAIWAAFWLAMGSTVFSLITWIVTNVLGGK
jgi:hypothetical protein